MAHLLDGPRQKKRRAQPPRDAAAPTNLNQVTRALVQMSLRHESQLQAQATEDQYILFLQAHQAGILQQLVQETGRWKEMAQKSANRTSLRQHLWLSVTQELLSRLTKLSQKKPQSWLKAVELGQITDQGAWHYVQWDPTKKALTPTSKSPIPMERMITMITELHESAQDPSQILRFKCLKRTQTNPGTQVIPWLVQISQRSNRLWEQLQSLSHSSVWLLIHARLRQHQARSNPLAETLVKFLKE